MNAHMHKNSKNDVHGRGHGFGPVDANIWVQAACAGAIHGDACQSGLQAKNLPQMLCIALIIQSNASIVSHSLFTAVLSMM